MVDAQFTPSTTLDESGDVISEIESHILKAVNELLRRAWSEGSEPKIVDRKSETAAECSGAVQDCEFGLLILTARTWLQERKRLEGNIADGEAIRKLTISLLRHTLVRITSNTLEFKGGKLEDDPVFFSGEPYTYYAIRKDSYFSSNLDAAMLMLAFFAAALKTYDDDLVVADFTPPPKLKILGVATLRDAALFVCKESLRYASLCRVEDNNAFVGFTCDPTSNLESRAANSLPGLLSDEDRLFFTWTTCETLYELSEITKWTDYLDRIRNNVAVPGLVAATKTLLDSLIKDLPLASDWCRATFPDRFRKMKAPPIATVVGEFAPLGAREQPSNPEITSACENITKYVQNVYHMSQYASIRSIAPSGITIDEVREIANRLDTLVGEHIIDTKLDEATHQSLYQTLTRYYKLGNSNTSREYQDDAYFPLVVRSLAGLLTRTITDLREKEPREAILTLIAEYRRSMRKLYKKLVARRPNDEDLEEGDQYLWSVAEQRRPFFLYATQRTVFALLAFKDLLEEMERFERPTEPVSLDKIHDLLAKSLAEVLLKPVIQDFARYLPNLMAAPTPDSQKEPQPQVLFPRAEWTHDAIRGWLSEFKVEFETQEQNICDLLTQRANSLVEFRKKLHAAREMSPKPRVLKSMENAMRDFLANQELRSLEERNAWQEATLLPALFSHFFRQLANTDKPLTTVLQLGGDPLWDSIESASQLIDTFNNTTGSTDTEKG